MFKEYPYPVPKTERDITIGIPRVLSYWDTMPFWTTFFKSLGYKVQLSDESTREIYESGLSAVTSDTVCFPAKLVHGHLRNLVKKYHVDHIFMPSITTVPPENMEKTSESMCAVVKGYPIVIRNSDNPQDKWNVPFDAPLFHWHTKKDRQHQLVKYMEEVYHVSKEEVMNAMHTADQAQKSFDQQLKKRGEEILNEVKEKNEFAVVLASRPYQNDTLVNHDLSKMFTKAGIAVLTADSLPEVNQTELSKSRLDIVNNYHARMLSSAILCAQSEHLEYVQLVSFGCGHDAYLSDEITRMMKEISGKTPLILKVDESDNQGPLGIRVRSFLETVKMGREKHQKLEVKELQEPYPVKFTKENRKEKIALVPNTSHAFCRIMTAALRGQGIRAVALDIGREEAIRLGKKYVHNDICFPAQMVIGELIGELKRGGYNQDEVAVGMVKFQCDCRMSHYAGLLRKGLDSAGFSNVPILTTDVNDTKRNHPGVFLLGVSAVLEAVWSFMMLDMLTDVCRKTRPYEINKGETDRVYQQCVDNLAKAIKSGIGSARKAFEQGMKDMAAIPYDRSHLKPKVFITGELLVTYHSGSNFNIERYMEENGMETIFPRITDQLRKDFLASMAEIKDYNANIFPYPFAVDWLFDHVQKSLEKTAVLHPLYKKALRPRDMYQGVKNIIPETLSCGEGWLMAAEIVHYAKEGVKSFIILQPFGCLPNHICGRGVIKRIKEDYPNVTILPLDLDPDTSYANVENRMQMMIMNS